MDVLRLPEEIWFRVLCLLQPEDLLALECVASRFARLTHDKAVLRTVRFRRPLDDTRVRRFFDEPRASAMVQLDLTDCGWLGGALTEQCVSRCVNLRVLKLLNCYVSPLVLAKLLETCLTQVGELEWSLVCSDCDLEPTSRRLDAGTCVLSRSLRKVYVDLPDEVGIANLLGSLLSRCVALRELHLHVHCDLPSAVYAWLAHMTLVPYAARCAPLLELETVTCTTNAVFDSGLYGLPSAFIFSPQLCTALFADDEELVRAFHTYVRLGGNLTLRLRPTRARSWVRVSELLAPPRAPCEGLTQLCLQLDDPMEQPQVYGPPLWEQMIGKLSLLSRAVGVAHWAQLDSLALVSSLTGCGYFPNVGRPLAQLLGKCGRLTELNLSHFHCAGQLGYCAQLGASGLRLRALALPLCAVADGSVHQLSPLRLRELYIGADLWKGDVDSIGCVVCCGLCIPNPLRSLALLGPLDRLTLCDLANVQSLAFLRDCSVADLRLSGLGRGGQDCPIDPLELGKLLRANDALRSLELRHTAVPLRSQAFWESLGQATRLRRLCLVSAVPGETPQPADVLRCLRRLPFLETLLVHREGPPLHALREALREALGTGGPVLDLGFDDVALPSLRRALWTSQSLIGLAKPRTK